MGFHTGHNGARRFSQPSSVKGFLTGSVTVGTTANNLLGVGFSATGDLDSGVRIKADSANAEVVFIGSNVGLTASNGFKLAANEEVFIDIDSLNKIFHISTGGGETLSFIAS
tara:strand:+ start:443 stop:778 length:336 start_codon:yes stop_codon:yes gene_type:complete